VRVDQLFDEHRARLRRESGPALAELSPQQIQLVEETYYAHLLDEDEEKRLAGFAVDGDTTTIEPRPTWEEHVEGDEVRELDARLGLARSIDTTSWARGEADEVLT
tara:strand:+ start:269 stop:586 length:318 start_codon:yes stop_codon:yes gene_type:complete